MNGSSAPPPGSSPSAGLPAPRSTNVRARAHASKSQLYHYFDDRDDLMRAVARAASDEVVDGQAGVFARLDQPMKLTIRTQVSNEGVVQGNGGRGENCSGGFERSEWAIDPCRSAM